MQYDYPSVWTEGDIEQLPDEDNRYEWKLGAISSQRDENQFRIKLSKEIGAFANSFGGTLFVGVSDDKKIVGVPRLWKGNQTIKEWLENVLPSLFEMRLQQFRVTEVNLDQATRNRIGNDRCVVAIDVQDSHLAPHQSSDKKYYYRVSGNSEPAPHHYLAFLWGRQNPNMTKVVEWWFSRFLDPLIGLVTKGNSSFNGRTFQLKGKDVGTQTFVFKYFVEFVSLDRWDELTNCDAGEYFLLTFHSLEREINQTREVIREFTSALKRLEKAIANSEQFRLALLQAYKQLLSSERVDLSQFDSLPILDLSKHFTSQLGCNISNYPDNAQEMLISFVTYGCLRVELSWEPNFVTNERVLVWRAAEIAEVVQKEDENLKRLARKARSKYELVRERLSDQLSLLKRERIEIAKRYSATFGD